MTIKSLEVYKCPKCHYDGKWSSKKSNYMQCYKCGKKWNPHVKKTDEHVGVMDKLITKVIF